MNKIKVGLIGVGNCASSLIQGLYYYQDKRPEFAIGLMHWNLGGYQPLDIEVAAAFDIDERKVGSDLSEAIFAPPNCTTMFQENVPATGVPVQMGQILDGFSTHMANWDRSQTFRPSQTKQPEKDDIVHELREHGVEVLMNYLPVGSEHATRFYAECALEAGCAFINNIPVFIASDPSGPNVSI